MKAYSVTQYNPEGIDRFQLYSTKEVADKVAALWVDRDNEMRQDMAEGDPEKMGDYEWRWIKEDQQWGYGCPDDEGEFWPIYTIAVSEVEIHETPLEP